MTARRLFGEPKNLLAAVDRRLVTGIYEAPLWYQAVRRVPPMTLAKTAHPGKIVFPEDAFVPQVYRRLPELTLDVPDLQPPQYQHQHMAGSSSQMQNQPQLAQRLAYRMHVLVQHEKMPHDDAWNKLVAEDSFSRDIERLRERIKNLRGNLSGLTAANAVAIMSSRFTEMDALRRLMAQTHHHQQPQQQTSSTTASTPSSSSSSTADVLTPPQQYNMARAQFDSAGHKDVVQLYDCSHLRPAMRPLVVRMLRANRARQLGQPISAADAELLASIEHDPSHPLRRPLYPLPEGARQTSATVVDKIPAAEASLLELTQRTLEWALRNAIIEPEASIRDFVAYCLRMQILALKRKDPIPWHPYMKVVTKELWRQANVVLTCKHAKNLVGPDMDLYQASLRRGAAAADKEHLWEELATDLNAADPTQTGLKLEQQLVRHQKEKPLSEEEVEKHKLLMFFIDRAIAAHDFDADQAAPQPVFVPRA